MEGTRVARLSALLGTVSKMRSPSLGAVFVAFTIYYSIQAWTQLHTPMLLDILWNPTMQLYEPIYMFPSPEYVNVLLFIPTAFGAWWNSPIYFQVPYLVSVVWLLYYLYTYAQEANNWVSIRKQNKVGVERTAISSEKG